jgi:4-amino-4-deoxy-L-arabinose transferase-like glycosyltransferase
MLPDEGRYVGVAWEMMRSGDWLTPTLNGLPFFHKPPLTYWADLLGLQLFGTTPFAARLGPALGAWLMGAALWLALRRRQGAREAGIALVVLATNPFWFLGGQYVNHDMLVAGTLTLAVLCLARALESGAPVLNWLLAGWAACALAVLAKGLIGIVLPALVIGPWLLLQGRWRDMLRLLHPLGLGVFVAIALPWFMLMQHRYPGFFDYFIVEQHFRRYAATGFNNAQPFWFFFAVLPLLTLPWSAWAPAALRQAWQQRTGSPVDRQWLGLLVWWALAILLFFSLPRSKIVGYILPALAPWCALLALALARSRWWRPAAAAGALLCVGCVVFLAWKAPQSGRDIGLALRERAAPADLVVMVDEPYHDVMYYARLATPPLVASDWADPELPLRDNWRKELADAVRFDRATGARVLYPLDQLPALVCRGRRVWLVAGEGQRARLAAVPGAALALQGKHAQLWQAEPRTCPGGR